MYNIIFKYLKKNNKEMDFPYIVYANSYEEAVAIVQADADDRVSKLGGSIISIV